jgi:2-C-methyl-D-erythritol 4-phosphate cytidylyltransferase / 2-C-methyl-D-erythritol 2,4-cyclodiphosphate synthase
MDYKAIIVAGGSGTRSGGKKQWMDLGGKPLLHWSVAAFASASELVIVVPPEDVERAKKAFCAKVVAGGLDRSTSVKYGLMALSDCNNDEIVLIHDAARPLLKEHHIRSLLQALKVNRAAILALPVTDTLKQEQGGLIIGTVAREHLSRAQTPQGFRLGDLRRAYKVWPTDKVATDEAMLVAHIGIEVALIEGDLFLHKHTYPQDLDFLSAMLDKDRNQDMSKKKIKPNKKIKIGMGFDAHRFGVGDHLWLCGVKIDFDKCLIGHSDADLALHALTDAILGTAGLGDIGDHFPPSDPQWQGAASEVFLGYALSLIKARGGNLINIDLTLIGERPKIKPHREVMRQKLCELTGLELDCVSLKATTTETMGFTGREEGMAAQAVCLVAYE